MTLGEFEPFCERYQSGMFNVAKAVLHDEAMAEDAVQIALKRIFKLFGKLEFDTEKKEKSYALRAAQNVAIDIYKNRQKDNVVTEENLAEASFQRGDTTFESVAAQETKGELIAAVRALSPKAQAIFKYREYGLKDAEIADTLGISVSDIRTTAFRARNKIAKTLRERGLRYE